MLRVSHLEDVIGVTTTGSAMNFELLKKTGPKVVICEEAGEVMESHTLCTLLPTIEHAIFIGDPEQLRYCSPAPASFISGLREIQATSS
jgi:AAA domain